LTGATPIDAEGNFVSDSFLEYIGVGKNADFVRFLFVSRFSGCMLMFGKNLIDFALPFLEGVSCHDWWLKIVASKKGIVKFIDRKLIWYRVHSANTVGAVKASLKNLMESYLTRGKSFMEQHFEILTSTLNFFGLHLTVEERRIVEDLLRFNSRKDKYISFDVLLIFAKYFCYFASNKKFYLKLIYWISALFGYKTIKRIWCLLQ